MKDLLEHALDPCSLDEWRGVRKQEREAAKLTITENRVAEALGRQYLLERDHLQQLQCEAQQQSARIYSQAALAQAAQQAMQTQQGLALGMHLR